MEGGVKENQYRDEMQKFSWMIFLLEGILLKFNKCVPGKSMPIKYLDLKEDTWRRISQKKNILKLNILCRSIEIFQHNKENIFEIKISLIFQVNHIPTSIHIKKFPE